LIPPHVSQRVTITRPGKPASGFGGAAATTTVYTDVVCGIYDQSGNAAVIYGGDRSTATGTARFQAGYTINEGDVITVGGVDLEIVRVFTRYAGLGIPQSIDCEWRREQVSG
jgi:hypothetical protein